MPEYRPYAFYRICPVDQHTCSNRACLGIEGYDETKCPGRDTPAPVKASTPAPAPAAPAPDPNPADQGDDWYGF